MKIGILTFHWAHNYGAVLQAYALYTYLARQGHDVEIINYIPAWCGEAQAYPFPRTPGILISNIDRYWRSRVFRSFQRKYLRISDHRYHYGETISGYDAVIVGSDQVFNPDIIAPHGQLDDTYLLASVAKGTRKIAYAASFGNSTLHPQFVPRFRELLSEFSAISVREESGCAIIKEMGLSGIAVPDPAILLHDFSCLSVPWRTTDAYILNYQFAPSQSFTEIIHTFATATGCRVTTFTNLKQYLRGQNGFLCLSPPQWIQSIINSCCVTTDSFHATVFCILTHTSFVSLPMDAWGNDLSERAKYLLGMLGLSDRLLFNPTYDNIKNLFDNPIGWDTVESKLDEMRREGVKFIELSMK